MKRFTTHEDDFLKTNYLELNLEQLGSKLNRAIGSIHGRLKCLTLIVPKELIKQRQLAGLKAGWDKGCTARFQKGHIPANKGQKMPEHVYVKAKPTMFKKGHKSHNALEVGTEVKRFSKGYYYWLIKLPGVKKLQYKHRHVWQQHYGPIPKGYNIQFKDRNTLNCNIENLYMISRQEQCKQNSIHSYPKEVVKTIRLVTKLNKTIKNYGKEQNR